MSRVQELIGEVKRPPFDILRAALQRAAILSNEKYRGVKLEDIFSQIQAGEAAPDDDDVLHGRTSPSPDANILVIYQGNVVIEPQCVNGCGTVRAAGRPSPLSGLADYEGASRPSIDSVVAALYLEVFDRVDSKTLTARLCRPVTDLFLVQWPEQERLYKDSVLLGKVW